jgi:hypothetical protein
MPEVRKLSGRRIDWHHPPKANAMCSLVLNGHKYKAGFRSLCHMNRLNNLARKRFGHGIVVLQPPYNSTVAASAGTHDKDAVWDIHIPGVGWWDQQRFFRANGFACWYRHPPLFGNHVHGFTLPPHRGDPSDDFKAAGIKVGKFIDGGLSLLGHTIGSSQIDDYYAHRNALVGHAHDSSWFPRDIGATTFNLRAYVARRAK